MILATEQDVVDRLRRDLTDSEAECLAAVLEESSVLVEAYLDTRGIAYDDIADVPRVVVIVASRIAARALSANASIPENAGTLQAGVFSAQFSEAYTSAVYLSRRDKGLLCGIAGSMVSVPVGSDRGYPDCDE